MLNEDIIPIAYFPGTGGNFLSHFLISAKFNKHILIRLSKTNHAHYCLRDMPSGYVFNGKDDKAVIDIILSQSVFSPAIEPYFVPAHIISADLLNSNFKRSIKIVYEPDDVKEISIIYYKKFYLSEENKDRSKNLDQLIGITRRSYHANKKENNCPNVLFISWKEYFKGDIESFITKLSNYTDINYSNFHKDSLIYWRMKTQECLDNHFGSID